MESKVRWKLQRKEPLNLSTNKQNLPDWNISEKVDRNKRQQNKNRGSQTCKIVARNLTFMSSESQNDRGKNVKLKNIHRCNSSKFPKFVKNLNLQIQEIEETSNGIQAKKSMS